jgi:homoserine/homoserine lactone efflux protein
MIDPGLYAAFVAAAAVLMLIPGPNVAMIVANSVAWGTRAGLLTVLATSTAMIPQLVVTALGMTAALDALGTALGWLRWVGVAYLVYLGLRQWFADPVDLTAVRPDRRPVARIFGRGFLVSLTNPKTLLFYGAFFPQFVRHDAPIGPQLALLCATFLVVAVAVDAGWACAAGRARGLLGRHGRLRNRLSGGFLMGAGAALAMARRS